VAYKPPGSYRLHKGNYTAVGGGSAQVETLYTNISPEKARRKIIEQCNIR
jgi:hypothetical protein